MPYDRFNELTQRDKDNHIINKVRNTYMQEHTGSQPPELAVQNPLRNGSSHSH
jgi:hypothetical protein